MAEKGTGLATFNTRQSVLGVFFFSVTCARDEMKRHMRDRRLAKKIPVMLSDEDVTRIHDAAPGLGLKDRAAFSVAYGGGLRASEVTHLPVPDIGGDLPLGTLLRNTLPGSGC